MQRMPPHETFFWVAFFFIMGTLAGAATTGLYSLILRIACIGISTGIIYTALYILNKPYAPLAAMLIIGGLYCIAYEKNLQKEHIHLGRQIKIEGIILHAEEHLDYQELRLANGLVITADRYPQLYYGDRIRLMGTVRPSRSPLVRGYVTARHTTIRVLGHHQGSIIKEHLYALKAAFEDNLKKVLPSEKAAFLAGLTVGSTAEFTNDFLADLRTTGTTHLVALSGSNISGILAALFFALTLFMPRKKTFWPALAGISAFVIMTGAEASLVRAAIMNGIFLAGRHYERDGNMRNAIIAAAFIMTLYNPLTPAFDLGFQLSFAAVLGMAYLQPVIEKIIKWKNDYLITAVAAQAAVMPVLAITVGHANPIAIAPNLLVAMAIPATVSVGFAAGALGFISTPLSFAPAWLANVLLSYEMGVIHLFARYM